MYKTIQDTWPRDSDLPARAYNIAMYRRVLDGTLYDNIRHPFSMENTDAGEYIPLRKRRPSVRTNLCRTVVDDSVALLFSEGRFPVVETGDDEQRKRLHRLLTECRLNDIMIEAATKGAVGSIAVLMQVLSGRVFFRVMDTDTLTPKYDPQAPDTLISVTEKYKVSGRSLAESGYRVDKDDFDASYWFQRVWDVTSEIWFQPWKITEPADFTPARDDENSTAHNLGFVPVAWIKNLPGGNGIDGQPTLHPEAIDCQIEVDYQLSQAGRGLKFMSDPTLVIKGDDGGSGPIVKGAANALMVSKEGDAKLLEIDGAAVAAVIDYVKHLREIALETLHGNRSTNEKVATAQSGRAMEMLNQPLIWLADKLRISYGEGGIVELVSMILRASRCIALVFKDGSKVGQFDCQGEITLRWAPWFAPTLHDMQARAGTLKTLCDSGLLSRQTAIRVLASEYDIEDPAAEKRLADADMAARNAGTKVQATISE